MPAKLIAHSREEFGGEVDITLPEGEAQIFATVGHFHEVYYTGKP